MKQILLFDGNHLARRSMYTVGKTLTTKSGIPSGAYYGSLKSLRKAVLHFNPSKILFFFDGGHKKQTELLDSYKAQRKRDPEEEAAFYSQLDDFRASLLCLGIVCIRCPGVEADQLIGAATGEFKEKYKSITIVSSDKDFHQLISGRVDLYDAAKGGHLNIGTFAERYPGLTPTDTIAIKALHGDTSDNVPGIKGVGFKTACEIVRLLGGYAGLVNWIKTGERLEASTPRIRNVLAEQRNRRTVLRNVKLVRLSRNLEQLDSETRACWDATLVSGYRPDLRRFAKYLRKYEIKSLMPNLKQWIKPLVGAGGLP